MGQTRVSAGYGRAGRDCTVFCVACQRFVDMRPTRHKLPSAEYDNNNRANCASWNLRHPDRPINCGVATILPSGGVHDPKQRLAYQFRSVGSGVWVEPEIYTGWLRRLLWIAQLR